MRSTLPAVLTPRAEFGPSGSQQFSITVGTGTSDRLLVNGAVDVLKTERLVVPGFDVNNGATYAVFVTSTGAELSSFTEAAPDGGGDGSFSASYYHPIPIPAELTVTDSLGSSVTVPVVRDTKY